MNFQTNISIPALPFQKGCTPFCFIRLSFWPLVEAVGADRLYRPIDRWWPVVRQFRSSRRFSIAIELVVHALKTARGEKQVTRPTRYGKRVPTRTKVHAGAHDALHTTRLSSIRYLSRSPFFFLFLFFSFLFVFRTNLRVFADVWRLTILINGVFGVQKRNRFSVATRLEMFENVWRCLYNALQ